MEEKLSNEINILLDKLNIKSKTLCVFLYGSYNTGYEDKYSDIDLLIIVNNKYPEETGRGMNIINKRRYEYYIDTLDCIYENLVNEIKTVTPITRNQVLHGKAIIVNNHEKLNNIIELAKYVDQLPYKRKDNLIIQLDCIYFNNYLNKLKRKKELNELDFNMNYYIYIKELIEAYYSINGYPLQIEKVYKSLKDSEYGEKNFQTLIKDDYVKKSFICLIENVDLSLLEELKNYIMGKYCTNIINQESYRFFY